MKNSIGFCFILIILMLTAASCGRNTSTTPGASTSYFDWWDGTSPASYDPLVIIAAPFGPDLDPAGYPTVNFPSQRSTYLNDIQDCYEAGASAVYVFPVAVNYEANGSYFDWSFENYSYIFTWISENCPDMVIGADISEAIPSTQALVLADTLVSFVSPVLGRYIYDGIWGGSSDPASIGGEIEAIEGYNVKVMPAIVSPQQADFMVQQILPAYLLTPRHFALHIGWENNCASTEDMFNTIFATLPSDKDVIVVCNMDNPTELTGLAVAAGYHLVVGMWNTAYWPGGSYNPVSSNAFLVEKALDVAIQMSRDIATPEEAKTILGVYR